MCSGVVPVMAGAPTERAMVRGCVGVRCGIGIAVPADNSRREQAFPASSRFRGTSVEAVYAADRCARVVPVMTSESGVGHAAAALGRSGDTEPDSEFAWPGVVRLLEEEPTEAERYAHTYDLIEATNPKEDA